jgi:hypothetical protein
MPWAFFAGPSFCRHCFIRGNHRFMSQRLPSFLYALLSALRALPLSGKVRLALAALGLTEFGFLVFAEKPWNVEVPEDRKPRLEDYVTIYSWLAALANLGVTAVLLATAGWWTRSLENIKHQTSAIQHPRWFWPLVAGAVVFTAAFAGPRLDYSLWDDEEYNMRYSILGKFQKSEDGEIRFRKLGWLDTFYDYREPNNHVLHSLLVRTCLEIWAAVTQPTGLPFTEWPLRVPAFLFGLASVATGAWFAREFIGARAGVLTAWLLALHPWVLRYASEARGYSMALCLLPVAFVLWRRCLLDGAVRWWVGYGVVQWAAIYAYPGVLFVLATLNILAVPILVFGEPGFRRTAVPLGRWFATNCFSATAVLQLMLPLYPQAKAYFAYETTRNFVLGWPWIQSTLAFLAAGVPLAGETPSHPSLQGLFAAGPQWLPIFAWGLGGLALLGVVRFSRTGWIGAAVAAAIVLPPILTFGISVSRRHLIYAPYVIYALPGLIAFVATALDWLTRRLAALPAGRVWSPAVPAVALAGFFLLTQPARSWLVANPLQSIEGSVLASRGTLDPWAPGQKEILTASFSIPPYLYDGHVERLESADDFIALMRRADREGKTLVVNIGMPWAARSFSPKMWELFQNPALFHRRLELQGFDSGLDRIVATYIPGSAEKLDFTPFAGPGR